MVVGLTGLPGELVRPRWQPTTPKQPEPHVDWCGMGVTEQANDAGPAIQHDPAGDGRDHYERHQALQVLCSFYGPNAKRYAQMLGDGLAMPQNQEPLNPYAIRFIEAGPLRGTSELVNQQWVRRFDVALSFRRKIARTYPVLNLREAAVLTTVNAPPAVATAITEQ